MSSNSIHCPSCNSDEVRHIGSLVPNNKFAGKVISFSIGGQLYECNKCFLNFRFPRPLKKDTDILYAEGNPEIWQYKLEYRQDWLRAIECINSKIKAGNILDVGCFDGQFLRRLEDGYKKYGIEINAQAAELARKHGIIIVNDDHSGDENAVLYDAVCGFDIVEHIEDPLGFIKGIARKVRKGGLLIISSGNSHSAAWKFMKSKYWYCSIAEHISFINPSWIQCAAKSEGLIIEEMTIFSHFNPKYRLLKAVVGLFLNLLYLASPNLLYKIKRFVMRPKDVQGNVNVPPRWIGAEDHLFVVLSKR